MKKPLPSLAIAIAILGLMLSPFRPVFAADISENDSTSASISAPDTAPADPTAAEAPPTSSAGSTAGDSVDSAISDSTDDASTTSSAPAASDAGSTAGAETSTSTLSSSDSPVVATSTPIDASTTPDADVSASDSATVTSTTTSVASTGDNTASSTATTTIDTGDAIAASGVLNVVNVNLFNSDALVAILNNISGAHNDVNLDSSAFSSDGSIGCSTCSVNVSTTTVSSPTSLDASSTDTATISNTSIVRATTGGNSASGSSANISTGNAYAAGSAATLANATLVDSHYVMLVLNNFGSWGGDLVLPGSSFWSSFLNSASTAMSAPNPDATTGTMGSSDISVDNAADVSTTASTSADTGENIASSTDGSTVQTGSAQSTSNAINDIDQTHIGGGSVDIIFHIFGNWSGQTFNLPLGFNATVVPGGLEITSSGPGSGPVMPTQVSLDSSNNANIQNNLDVSASTGGNDAEGSNANISTGNAYAAASSITAANVTSISHNWLAAIVNVFGDWNGNVSFGQPDLWVGIRAEVGAGSGGPNTPITYHYTIRNNGDAAAHGVRLSRSFGSSLIVGDPSVTGDSWDIGTLDPGESRDVTETAHVTDTLPSGNQAVSNTATVSESETDGNTDDNSDVISVVVGYPTTDGGGGSPGGAPNFSISKTEDATSTISASSTVGYTIHLVNNGGQANHALVADQITDEDGNIIHSENWDLGIVHAGEDITLTYTAFFSASTTPGAYINSAQVIPADGQFASSTVATTSVTIGGSVDPVALVTNLSGSSSSFGSSGSRFSGTSTLVTVRRPLSLGFLDPSSAPQPPDAGGVIPNRDLLASVGDAMWGPYSWPLYLLVILAGLWYFVTRRELFGWSRQKARQDKK